MKVSPLALNDVETRPAMPARSERRRSEYPVCVTDAVRVGPVALPELVALILYASEVFPLRVTGSAPVMVVVRVRDRVSPEAVPVRL